MRAFQVKAMPFQVTKQVVELVLFTAIPEEPE